MFENRKNVRFNVDELDKRRRGILRQPTGLVPSITSRYEPTRPTGTTDKKNYIGELYQKWSPKKVTNPQKRLEDLIDLYESSFGSGAKDLGSEDLGKTMEYIQKHLNYYVEDPLLSEAIKGKVNKYTKLVKPVPGGNLYDLVQEQLDDQDKFNKEEYQRIKRDVPTGGEKGFQQVLKRRYRNNPLVQYGLELQKQIKLNNLFKKLKGDGNAFKKFYQDLTKAIYVAKTVLANDREVQDKLDKVEKQVQEKWDDVYKEMIDYLDLIYKAETDKELDEIEKEIEFSDQKKSVEFCMTRGKYVDMLKKLQEIKSSLTEKENKSKFKEAMKAIKSNVKRGEVGCGDGKETKLTLKKFLEMNK
jgi:hypothetical protein